MIGSKRTSVESSRGWIVERFTLNFFVSNLDSVGKFSIIAVQRGTPHAMPYAHYRSGHLLSKVVDHV